MGRQYVGEASAETNESLAEQAEREVCRKLWEAEKIDCKDERRATTVSRQTRLTMINGKMTHTVRLIMRTMGGSYRGKASSVESGPDACRRAVDDACQKAPADSECGSRGLYCEASPEDPGHWSCAAKPSRPAPSPKPSPHWV